MTTTASSVSVSRVHPEFDEDSNYMDTAGAGGANVAKGLTNVAKALVYAADTIAAALERQAIPNVYPTLPYPQPAPWQPTEPYQPYWTGSDPEVKNSNG